MMLEVSSITVRLEEGGESTEACWVAEGRLIIGGLMKLSTYLNYTCLDHFCKMKTAAAHIPQAHRGDRRQRAPSQTIM